MTPTYEELLKGTTQFRNQHRSVNILVSFHGFRRPDYSNPLLAEGHPGIWCYYLIIPEQMYPHRWDDFRCTRDENGFEHYGKAFENVRFYGGITWSSSEPYFDRKTMKTYDASKVGCDYNHIWDKEMGYPDTLGTVKDDAECTVNEFLEQNPDFHIRCSYSGIWSPREEFYEAKNGCTVHNFHRGTFSEGWSSWEPKES